MLHPVNVGGREHSRRSAEYVAVCCSMLQCVALCCTLHRWLEGEQQTLSRVCCSVLQCVGAFCTLQPWLEKEQQTLSRMCCSVLQCVAVCCSLLQYIAPCNVDQRENSRRLVDAAQAAQSAPAYRAVAAITAPYRCRVATGIFHSPSPPECV